MTSNISFAIVGCGNIGQRHALHINNFAKLAAVCDIDIAKATALGNQYHVNKYFSLEELLVNEPAVEVIAICTPNGLHAPQTIECLKAGHHVVCEKPMAIHMPDGKQMIAASEQYNKYLFIVKQNRFNKAVAEVKKALMQNALGTILSFQINCFWNRDEAYYRNSWHGTRDLDGGTLFTQFSHFIDILYWLLGDVKEVQSYLQNRAHPSGIAFEDTGAVILHMQSGAIGTLNYTVNTYKENMEGSFTLFGEKGTIKIGGQYLNIIQYQNIQDYVLPVVNEHGKANDYGTYKGSMSNHDKVYQNVLDVLQNGAAISTNAHEGLKTVEIIERIYAANLLNI
ncbi:Gfo/Idh/MocA family oxidoreductase [Ilyomonas limi]|uniref:Gfo/Idh/MocA family oxidoreductase n=1 Tax=Ilyomonas limi TaxID=2575867 RepID=A0A4U3KXX5_9BACT|nr:Gfo/Idh/MocA family oxidoreductase [Ilyomonas limi]TKK65996.1 Gfo/Idh/MocA family oxidoreductase [Ilyomonas limi]